ncbi:major facilitator superfamily domain-containing protein [Aspergillus insuetus]
MSIPRSEQETDSASPEPRIGKCPECFKSTFHEISFVIMATLAMATDSLVTGAMIIVTSSIGRDLDMTQAQITWIRISLTAGAFQLPLGQLSGLLDRKPFFIAGLIGFSASSLILGFAQNAFWLNVLAGFLGLFSTAIVPPAAGILGAAYGEPSKRKNWVFACFSAGTPVGFGVGSIVMGVAGFFFFSIIWTSLAVVACWAVAGWIEAYEAGSFRKRLRVGLGKFDGLGTALTVLGVGLLTTGLTLGPADGWKTAHVISMLIVRSFLLIAFVFWKNHCRNPLMPLHIWKDRVFSLLNPISILGVIAMISSNFWLALFLQGLQHRSALGVAVDLLAQVISAIISNIVAANILHRVNNSLIMVFGAAMYVLASILLAVQDPHAVYWALIFPSLLTNIMGLDCNSMYVMQSLPAHQQSLAAGIFNMFIRLGTIIGLRISTAVYSSVQKRVGESEGDTFQPFRAAFYVSVGFAVLACVFVPFLRVGTQGGAVKRE